MENLEISKKEAVILGCFVELSVLLDELKSQDRTERDRRIAVTKTELEKTFAYFKTFVYSS